MSKSYKSYTQEDCDRIFTNVNFPITPRLHQYQSLIHASNKNHVALFHGVGSGKTITALYISRLWRAKKTLVVTPISGFSAFVRDIKQATNRTYIIVEGTAKQRAKCLKKDVDIYIINYEGLRTLYMRDGQVVPELMTHDFDVIIYDEIHRCGNYSTQQTQICAALSILADKTIGLSGTPIKNSRMELFSIFNVLDSGDTFGDNFFKFRDAFFYKYDKFNWELKTGAKEKINQLIAPNTTSYSLKECVDIPKQIKVPIILKQSKEQIKAIDLAYDDIYQRIVAGELQGDNVLVLAQKLRQISGGFLKTSDDLIHIKNNPKLRAVADILQDTDGKIVIFHNYREEGELLKTLLKKKKVGFTEINGGITKQQVRRNNEEKFNKDPKCRVMLMTSAAMESYDFTVSSKMIFYSNTYSSLIREQVEGRIYRSGQNKHPIYYDLILKGTPDEAIREALKKKKEISQAVLQYLQVGLHIRHAVNIKFPKIKLTDSSK